jgi:urea transport system substrate-binding protein
MVTLRLIMTIIILVLSSKITYQCDTKRSARLLEAITGMSCAKNYSYDSTEIIKVGILQSLTGTMSISEKTLVSSILLAIDEINSKGGVLGKKLEIVLEDGASDWPTFTEKAQKLIDEDQVDVIFCCWTSASRKAVLPIVEEKDHILFYPLQYEGQECSKNIFYMGAAPNQQINPAVTFMNKKYPNRNFFLIGSDYVFPRTANKIISNQVKNELGLKSMEFYIPLGSSELDSAFKKIVEFLPDGGLIFNTLNGDSNVVFFTKYSEYLSKDKYAVISFSVSEVEAMEIGIQYLEGHYAAWNYFMSINTNDNYRFLQAFTNKYGGDLIINDPMEASYIGVYMWSQAVEQAGTTEVKAVRKAVIGQSFEAAEGRVEVGKNHHLIKYPRIGKLMKNGQFEIVQQDPATTAQPWSKWIPEQANNPCDFSHNE